MSVQATEKAKAEKASTPAAEARQFAADLKVRRESGKELTRAEQVGFLAWTTGLERRQVEAILGALAEMVAQECSRRGPGAITLRGLCRFKRTKVAARKARIGINPRTREPLKIAARPEHWAVKITPRTSLEEAI